jgi:hypothetical protein
MEAKGIVKAKAGSGKGFLLDNDANWFSVKDNLVDDLAKVEKGTEIEVTYTKNGTFRNVSVINVVAKKAAKTEAKSEGFACEDCGAALKDGKYKKCFMCNKKAPKETAKEDKPATNYNKSNYGSPEDVAGKEVGCAAGVAGKLLSGRQEDPETMLEMWKILTNGILEHIRNLK